MDAGQQDYLVMIFSIVVVGSAGFGMLSALGHFMLRVSKKPKRKAKFKLSFEEAENMVNKKYQYSLVHGAKCS